VAFHTCPTCKRVFEVAGFCPYDGQTLTLVTDSTPTVASVAMPAVEQPVTLASAIMPAQVQLQTFRSHSAHTNTDSALSAMRAHESEYDRMIGQTLDGRYHIDRKLGEGGMGVVFAARHAVIERPLAIKVLKREVMREAATIKRFVQEAKAASRIGHPNIVDVTDFGTTADGLTYQVMELIDGVTLGHALRVGGVMPATRVIRIIAQMARALGAAHTKGIVHRDLKPDNVFLLERDGRHDFVKIVDFGIAKVIPVGGERGDGPKLTRAGSVFGTPEYMAPEQASGRGDVDGRADIYALGTIAYELLTGRVPHRGDSVVRTLAMQMLDPVEPPSRVRPDLTIPPALEQVVMRALAKKPAERYQTMAELVVALEAASGGSLAEPVSTAAAQAYQLPALPPGASAEADGTPTQVDRTRRDSGPDPSPPPTVNDGPLTTPGGRRRPESTQRRYVDEPAFVSNPSASAFEHLLARDSQQDLPEPTPGRRGRGRMLVLVVLVLAAGAGGAAFALWGQGRGGDGDQAAMPADAAMIAVRVSDAAPAQVPTAELADAAVVARGAVDARVGAGHGRQADAAEVVTGPPVTVKVLTEPARSTVYLGRTFRGSGGVTMQEPRGTQAQVRCSAEGHVDGTVAVTWDHDKTVTCRMRRRSKCVDGLHNPFDDCPDAGPVSSP
jgi:serine/threonine protein kinase